MKINAYSSSLKEQSKIPILLDAFGSETDDDMPATYQPSILLANWSSPDRRQRIAATFTNAISTFTGEPVVRVQFTSNGNLPDVDKLKDVLSAMIVAGRKRIQNDNYANTSADISNLNDAKMTMCFHALRNPRIAFALKKLGAEVRELGNNPMYPVITDFENTPENVIGVRIKESRPLIILSPKEALLAHTL